MKRHSLFTPALVLVACSFFLWMFFAAATLERAADLGRISAPAGQDARAVAYEFAAKWRHGMAGNSPLYMPGFFAAAFAIWFWCATRSLPRMLVEGAILIVVACWCATLLTPFAMPRIIADFRAQHGFIVSDMASSGTWVAFAKGVYTLLTWSALVIASRWSIKLRSPRPLVVPLVLYLVLALVRPWTVADFSSQWMSQTLGGEPVAVVSFLLIPILSGFMASVELRSPRDKIRGIHHRVNSAKI
ncbi:MAG: hypothetical protein ACRD9S_25675 [Pyrinomonadaceae bacterium]